MCACFNTHHLGYSRSSVEAIAQMWKEIYHVHSSKTKWWMNVLVKCSDPHCSYSNSDGADDLTTALKSRELVAQWWLDSLSTWFKKICEVKEQKLDIGTGLNWSPQTVNNWVFYFLSVMLVYLKDIH